MHVRFLTKMLSRPVFLLPLLFIGLSSCVNSDFSNDRAVKSSTNAELLSLRYLTIVGPTLNLPYVNVGPFTVVVKDGLGNPVNQVSPNLIVKSSNAAVKFLDVNQTSPTTQFSANTSNDATGSYIFYLNSGTASISTTLSASIDTKTVTLPISFSQATPAKVVVSVPPQLPAVTGCGVGSAELRDGGNLPAVGSTSVDVNLSASGVGGPRVYSDSNCSISTSKVTISNGSSQAIFYFAGTNPIGGNYALQASSAGLISGQATGSFMAQPPLQLSLVGPTSLVVGQCAPVTGTLYDSAGTAVSVTQQAFPVTVSSDTNFFQLYSDSSACALAAANPAAPTAPLSKSIALGTSTFNFYMLATKAPSAAEISAANPGAVSGVLPVIATPGMPAKAIFTNVATNALVNSITNGTLQLVDRFNNYTFAPALISLRISTSGPATCVGTAVSSTCVGGSTTANLTVNANQGSIPFQFAATAPGSLNLHLTSNTSGITAGPDVSVTISDPLSAPNSFKFIMASSINAGDCAAVKIRLVNPAGATVNATYASDIALNTSSTSGQYFSGGSCSASNAITSATLAAGQHDIDIYYRETTARDATLSAASTAGATGSKFVTTTSSVASQLKITGPNTAVTNTCYIGTVSAFDAFGNTSAPTNEQTINIAAQSGALVFSDSACGTPATSGSITLSPTNASALFSVRFANPGQNVISATNPGADLAPASLAVLVTGTPAGTFTLTSANPNVVAGSCVKFTVASSPLVDRGNLITQVSSSGIATPLSIYGSANSATQCGSAIANPLTLSSSNSYTKDFYVYVTAAGAQVFTVTGNGNTASFALNISAAAPSKLVFDNSVPGLIQTVAGGPQHVSLKDAFNNTATFDSDVSLTFSPSNFSGNLNFKQLSYLSGSTTSGNECESAGAAPKIPANTSDATFYICSTEIGGFSLTVSANTATSLALPFNVDAIQPIQYWVSGNPVGINPLDFGSVALNDSSSVIVQVRNTSTTYSVNLKNRAISPNPTYTIDPLATATACATGDFTLAPNASCDLKLTYSPRDLYLPSYGNLSFGTNLVGPNLTSTASALLVGRGTPAPFSDISVSPASYNFGAAALGATIAPRSFAIMNTGSLATTIQASIVGDASSDFTITGNNCPSSLAASASCGISVNFHPSRSGARSAALNISFTGGTADASPKVVSLEGTGNAPATLVSNVSSLNYNPIVYGTSAVLTATITNTGDSPATAMVANVTGANAANFQGALNKTTLNPGENALLTITFSPTGSASAGFSTFQGNLAVTYNNGLSTQTTSPVALAGEGSNPPALIAALNPLNFGAVEYGTLRTAVQTLSNPSAFPATLVPINPAGAISMASQSFVVPARGQISFPVSATFDEETGVVTKTFSFTATYVVPGNSTPIPLTNYSFAAQANPVLPPRLVTNIPYNYAFGNVTLNSASTTPVVQVTNVGGAPTTLSGFTFTGPNPADFQLASNTCVNGLVLAPGASCSYAITFRPTSIGAKRIFMVVSYPLGSVGIDLTGNGVTAGSLAMSPGAFTFPNTIAGTTSATAADFVVTNSGGTAITGLAISAPSAGFAQVAIGQDCTNGMSLAAGATCKLGYRFTPAAAQTYSNTVRVSGTTASVAVSVAATLTGLGTAQATVQLGSAGGITFGSTFVGMSSSPNAVRVTNTGATSATFTVSSNNSTYVTDSGSCSGYTIPAGGECAFNVYFRPQIQATQSGSLTVTPTGSATGGFSIWTSGLGVAYSGQFAFLDGAGNVESAYGFGALVIGNQDSRTYKSIMPTNRAWVRVQNLSIAISGSPYYTLGMSSGGAVPTTLNTGTPVAMVAQFLPQASGSSSALITAQGDLVDDYGHVVHQAPTFLLSGIGLTRANLTIDDANGPNIGAIRPNGIAQRNFMVRNTGDVPATINASTFTGEGFGYGNTSSNYPGALNGCGPTIAAHSNCIIGLKQSYVSGAMNGRQLRIDYNDGLTYKSVAINNAYTAPLSLIYMLYHPTAANGDYMASFGPNEGGYSPLEAFFLSPYAINSPVLNITVPFVRCHITANSAYHFVSTDVNCEGQTRDAIMGYMAAAPIAGTMPSAVYRNHCTVNGAHPEYTAGKTPGSPPTNFSTTNCNSQVQQGWALQQ